MDEFLDDFSSPPWPDMSTNVRASWVGSTPGHTNGLLADPIGVFEGGGKNSTISMIPSRQVIESLGKHTHNGNSTILVSGNSNYIHDKELFLSQTPPAQEAPDHMLASSQHVNGSHESEFSLQSMIESNSSVGLHSISSIPSIWPSTYANVPSFAVGPQTALTRSTGLQTHQQMSQSIEANSMKHCANQSSISQLQPAAATGGGSNGAVRPRVRARRGQATDPHSIAERLRREKIAERMRNLQELVPNSNKTDKASMLDEIIDYVKFLQLQVKVLSMSRMGAAGAVVPLITDVQSEASGGLLLSASVGQEVDPSDSQETVVFEKEVMKLMESSVTTAMQYLQNKGMCLMPIALATAISGGKNSTNNTMTHGITSLSSNSSTPGFHASSSCSESFTKESTAKNESREDAATSGCNGSTGFKQEQTSFFTSEV